MYITQEITNISLFRDIPAKLSNGGARYTRVTPLFVCCSNETYIKRGKVGSKVRVKMALPSDSEIRCNGGWRSEERLKS
jgi:hypothetical protein